MNLQFPVPNNNYKVLIRCNTYNQKKYIKDTLKGFTIQSTDFPFCALIIDDASTDGEQDLLKEYIQSECDTSSAEYMDSNTMLSCVVRHKTNGNCTFVFMLLKENHWQQGKPMAPYYKPWRDHSEYEALCEGDDYWIADTKLQEQVSILDADKDVSIVHTGFKTVDSQGNEYRRNSYVNFQKISSKQKGLVSLFDRNHIMTLSIMFRADLEDKELFKGTPFLYDYAYFFTAAFLGKVRFIPSVMGAYRMNPNSLMNTKNKKVNSELFEVYKYYTKEFYQRKFNCLSLYDKIYIRCKILANTLSHRDKDFCEEISNMDKMTKCLYPVMAIYEYFKHKLK